MNLMIAYAMQLVGLRYAWGGDNFLAGFDCSGLCIELGKSVGLFPNKFDASADVLFNTTTFEGDSKRPGAWAIYGKNRVIHIATFLDSYRVVEAGAGSKRIKTVHDAMKHKACVRIRPYDYRKDYRCTVFPKYPEWLGE